MNKIVTTWNKIELIFMPDNNLYRITMPGFILENCAVKIRIDDDECIDFQWQQISLDETSLILSSQNEYGRWKLSFTVSTEQGASDSLNISLSGELNCKARKLELIPLAMPSMAADHLLVHGRKMGGCDLIKLPVKDDKEISSIFQ